MLIELDLSLYDYLYRKREQLSEESIEIIALNNLASAYRNGWHIIIGHLKVLKFIRKIESIDSSTKRVFEKLINEYTFQKSYKDIIDEYILVKDSNHTFQQKGEENKKVFEVPIPYFSGLASCLKSTLLCEDESDYDFYIKLVKKFITENEDISNIGLSFSFANGGGANSSKVLHRLITENSNPILTLADSDKKHPNSSVGQTLAQLKRVEGMFDDNHILEVYSIKVRAKENLIPPSLYSIGTNSSSAEYLEVLRIIEQQIHLCEKLLYFNIKDGYKVKHFYDQEFLHYYSPIFIEVHDLISCTIEELLKKEDKEETVVPGASGLMDQFIYNILDGGLESQLEKKIEIKRVTPEILESIEILKKNIEKKKNLFNSFPDYLKPIVIQLCKKILSWGCRKGEMLST